MNFEFATATRVIFGAGSYRRIETWVKDLGRRALVVGGRRPEPARRLEAALREHGVAAVGYSISAEPDLAAVGAGVSLSRQEKCDWIIAIGGGSVIDAGKAIAAMSANPGDVLDYLEVIGKGRPLRRRALRFVAIPTTAGTGAEVTRNAVLASAEHRVKVSLRSAQMLPTVALVDPELTYDLPPALTASTGLDALTQLIEPFTCTRANPLTDALCREGMMRVARSLRVAFRQGQNMVAREDMALAGLFGGLALTNAGLGAAHGFAAPIGGMFTAPHGAVCAALLPHVMAVNLRALRTRGESGAGVERYHDVARIVTGTELATAADGVRWVAELVRELNIPKLSAYGIRAQHVPELTAKAASASSMKANPVVLSAGELSEILQAAL